MLVTSRTGEVHSDMIRYSLKTPNLLQSDIQVKCEPWWSSTSWHIEHPVSSQHTERAGFKGHMRCVAEGARSSLSWRLSRGFRSVSNSLCFCNKPCRSCARPLRISCCRCVCMLWSSSGWRSRCEGAGGDAGGAVCVRGGGGVSAGSSGSKLKTSSVRT